MSTNTPQQRLLALFERLDEAGRSSLLDYAEFLAARMPEEPAVALIPEYQPRPDDESVVGAIKRLSAVYHMLDRSKMLHETSGLMAQHMLHGREAPEVIDELEELFRRYYESQFGDGTGKA